MALVFSNIATLTVITTKTTQFGLKDIGELATQAGYYTTVQSIKNAREVWGWQVPFTDNRYIFSYDGTIKAGIDFADISLSVNELTKTITVTFPEFKILSNEIDEESLQIFDEVNNIFTPLTISTITDARIDMKNEAEEKAVANGLLENARSNAEILIRGFLAGSYDMSVYSIEFK